MLEKGIYLAVSDYLHHKPTQLSSNWIKMQVIFLDCPKVFQESSNMSKKIKNTLRVPFLGLPVFVYLKR